MAHKKDDIDRKPMNHKNSGKKSYSKEALRNTKVFPDKAYDPMKLFRSHLADNNNKNEPKHMQRENNVADQEHNYPGHKDNRYKHIKNFLRTMNLRKK